MESKSDVIKALEREREKCYRYETKLKDLVAAYKSQVKENETLQATIRSLRASSRTKKTSRQDESNTPTEQDTSGDDGDEEKAIDYQQELDKLTNSMTELMEEKKLIQAAAIAERKALKQDYEEKIEKEQSKCDDVTANYNQAMQQATELRKKLRNEQMEREKEQTDQAAMIRELNKRIKEHIMEKDDMNHQIKDLQKELSITRQQSSQSSQLKEYETIIADLTNQLQETATKVRECEDKANQRVTLEELQQQISEIKHQHTESIAQEQLRADEAEHKLGEMAGNSESRICELESKVSQLSEMVGKYEQLRLVDQQSIQKLKDRVTQLDMENTALAKVASPEPDDDNLNINEITDKLKNLKDILKRVCETEQTVDYHLKLGEVFMNETKLHKKCDDDYNQLKEEFERYKLRAQSVLKNKNTKDNVNHKEVEDLKNTAIELREKLKISADRHLKEVQSLQQTVDELRQSITNLHATHKQELTSISQECEQKVTEAENRLRQHRDRTISLLAEKDEEIEILKKRCGGNVLYKPIVEGQEELYSPVEELFVNDQVFSSGQLVHFQQEIARNNLEITTLRRHKHDLEKTLSEVQSNMSSKQEHYEEQIAFLKEEVNRLDRNKSREGINLEYLKNIVYRYMTASDVASRKSIFTAIATILHFSPSEKKAASHNLGM